MDPKVGLKINVGHSNPVKSVLFPFNCYENYLDRYLVRHRSTLLHWLVGHEVKVSMTCVSRYSNYASVSSEFSCSFDFALYRKEYYIYMIMSLYDLKFDLKRNVGNSDLFSSDFADTFMSTGCKNIILFDESVWPKVWPLNKCRSQ